MLNIYDIYLDSFIFVFFFCKIFTMKRFSGHFSMLDDELQYAYFVTSKRTHGWIPVGLCEDIIQYIPQESCHHHKPGEDDGLQRSQFAARPCVQSAGCTLCTHVKVGSEQEKKKSSGENVRLTYIQRGGGAATNPTVPVFMRLLL